MTARRVILAGLILATGVARAAGGTIRPGDHTGAFDHGGQTRTYLLHVPKQYDGLKPLPLVVMLHGGFGSGRQAARSYGWSEKADRVGFFVVYPDGIGRVPTWNAMHGCGEAYRNKVDDVGFIRQLIARLRRDLKVDTKRIYATGMSNGAMLSHRLGAEMSDVLAAIAPVAGSVGGRSLRAGPLRMPPAPKHNVAAIIFHGTKDAMVPYEGGRGSKSFMPRWDASVTESAAFWVESNRCRPRPVRQELANGKVKKETYAAGPNGVPVVLVTVVGGEHAWPGGRQTRFLKAGHPDGAISATEEIWTFFAAHPRRSPAAKIPVVDSPAAVPGPGLAARSLRVDGRSRTFLLHVPTSAGKEKPAPLVFVFHGGGGTSRRIQGYTAFDELAEKEGFFAIFPDAVDGHWNDGRKVGQFASHKDGVDDVKFVRAMLDWAQKNYAIDPKRIYATGASNGAFMSHCLANAMADRFAAFAPVIGGMAPSVAENFRPPGRASMLIMNGTADKLVPYHGGRIQTRGDRGSLVDTDKAVQLWVAHNGCTRAPKVETLPDADPKDGARVERRIYAEGKAGTEVHLYVLKGGGHHWPGQRESGAMRLPAVRRAYDRIAGPPCNDIDATRIVWNFFKTHPKK